MTASTQFKVRINNGPIQNLRTKSGFYVAAASAAPAILGIRDYPVKVTIWAEYQGEKLDKELVYVIPKAGGAACQVVTRFDGVNLILFPNPAEYEEVCDWYEALPPAA